MSRFFCGKNCSGLRFWGGGFVSVRLSRLRASVSLEKKPINSVYSALGVEEALFEEKPREVFPHSGGEFKSVIIGIILNSRLSEIPGILDGFDFFFDEIKRRFPGGKFGEFLRWDGTLGGIVVAFKNEGNGFGVVVGNKGDERLPFFKRRAFEANLKPFCLACRRGDGK